MDNISIIPYQYSKFLFYSSFSMLICAIISIIMNDIYVTLYIFILFLTSINHWRRPEYGLRRNIDMFVVKCGVILFFYQVCLLKNEFCRYVSVCMLICSISFYIFENILEYFHNLQWIIFHMTIHLYMSLCILFIIFN